MHLLVIISILIHFVFFIIVLAVLLKFIEIKIYAKYILKVLQRPENEKQPMTRLVAQSPVVCV